MTVMYQNKMGGNHEKNQRIDNTRINPIAGTVFAIILVGSNQRCFPYGWSGYPTCGSAYYVVVMVLIGTSLLYAIKIARQWEKAVVLRMGRFHKPERPRFLLDDPPDGFNYQLD